MIADQAVAHVPDLGLPAVVTHLVGIEKAEEVHRKREIVNSTTRSRSYSAQRGLDLVPMFQAPISAQLSSQIWRSSRTRATQVTLCRWE